MSPCRTLLPLLLVAGSATAGERLSVPLEQYELDNGLVVVLAPDHSAPIVHVQAWYHVGSKDEAPGRTGFAHLFEHLMFQGSKNSPGEYFTPIQQVGGNLNGTTNDDRTNYFETVPARYLPMALFMESDRMGALLDVLDQGKLDNQREVVRNERRQRYENPPYGNVWIDLNAAMWPADHPYHHVTIGSHADLEAATLDDVTGFFRTWYVPNNATLVVAGDFDPAQARSLVQEHFGWIPAGPEPTPVHASAAPLAADVRIVQHDEVPDHKVWIAWRSPEGFAKGDAELDVVASLLCGGNDSRLVRRLVEKERIARDVECSQISRRLEGMFLVEATATEGHTTDELVAAVRDELSHLTTDAPPTAEEVTSAVTSYRVGFYRGLETIQGKAGTLSAYLARFGRADWVQRDLDRYLKLNPKKVWKVARTAFAGHHLELHVLPEDAATPATTTEEVSR